MSAVKIPVAGLLPHEICTAFQITPAFRGVQIFSWIGSGATSFGTMTNLPLALRQQLEGQAVILSSSVSDTFTADDGTIKLQIKLEDGDYIEAVLLSDIKNRKTACVSCQTGCAMRCAFCRTGQLEAGRNLSAAEIVEEFMHLESIAGKLDNIVFMGMGEPMLNLQSVRKAVAVLTAKEGRNLSARKITVSTAGVISGIYDMADNGPHARLAVSLTTADADLREKLMPAAKTNPLPQLKQAVLYYTQKTGRRCTFEIALLAGVNTGDRSVDSLIRFVSDMDAHVNLIPWNPVQGLPFAAPSRRECERVLQKLQKSGINATLRTKRGGDIAGACGQLGGRDTDIKNSFL